MNAVASREWKLTSFSSYLKTFLTRDLPVYAVLASVFFGGNYIAQSTLNSDAYSSLAFGFDVGIGYLGVALLGFFALLSAAGFGASLYAGFYSRQPMAVWLRLGIMSLALNVACQWAFVHMLRGDLGDITTRTAALLGL